VVTDRQAVVDAEANLRLNEVQLKNLLSRSGTADPVLASVRILPTDSISIPPRENLPPLEELGKLALANRSDLAAQKASNEAAEVSALGTRNGVLPNAQVFAGLSNAGLAGEARTVGEGSGLNTPDPYFVGGLGTALGQVFRRNFPTERVGAGIQTPIHNWQAQADYAIDQLQLRQSDLSLRKSFNQAQVDVLNQVVSLQQARARYEAAVKNRALAEELLRAERQKFSLGASTPYNVVLQQRDLVTAQAALTAALVQYSTARIGLDRALGATLEANNVSIGEARGAAVARPADPPPADPPRP
jgi:outer membrane protein TolC